MLRFTSFPTFAKDCSFTSFFLFPRFASKFRDMSTAVDSSPSIGKILVTCRIPKLAREFLSNKFSSMKNFIFQIEFNDKEDTFCREELLTRVEHAHGIFCILEDKIDAELLCNAKCLKVISTMSVGYDHIDLKECDRLGILVGNTPGVLTDTTADLVVSLMLATCRRIPEGIRTVQNGTWGKWKPEWLCGKDLHHSTVGIIGLGRIGQAVAQRLHGFQCRILYCGPSEKPEIANSLNASFVDFDTLLYESDFIVPQCPLNQETRGMFNHETFRKMKRGSIFINTARGGLVDDQALLEALSLGYLWAAGLDVTSPEPLPNSHPLLQMENVVILPHLGSATSATRTKMAMIAAENLVAGMSGKPMISCVSARKIINQPI